MFRIKIAFLVQCHKNPYQINQLIKVLYHKDIDIYIHVDKKSSISNEINQNLQNVFMVSDDMRIDVKWGTFSQIEATMSLIKTAIKNKKYDYYWLISGQDFPLTSSSNIIALLENNNAEYINFFKSKNNGLSHNNNYDKRNEIYFEEWMFKRDFLHRVIRRLWVFFTGGYNHTFRLFLRKESQKYRFYFGSSWWCLSGECMDYIVDYINTHPEYEVFLKNSSCPDECFFQTLVMQSPYAGRIKDYLHYIDWSEGNSSPKTLTVNDVNLMFESRKVMARKIDNDVDNKVIEEILRRIKDESK